LLLDQFANSFAQADRVIALDIYASREPVDPSITTAAVVERMGHSHAIHIPDRRNAADYLLERLHPDDVVLTLGAGDGDVIGKWILEGLQLQQGNKR
jgi:UDP-N-acetylmuramate--alanine ligase